MTRYRGSVDEPRVSSVLIGSWQLGTAVALPGPGRPDLAAWREAFEERR